MSVEAMTLVLHHSKASGAAQMILMGIANHQGDGGAWPSIATLAKYGKVSERRVQQIVRELEEIGELVVYQNAGGKTSTGATNLYQVVLSCPDDCDGSMNHKTRQGVKFGDTRGEIWSHQGVKPISPKPVIEPSIETIYAPSELNEFFNRFYKAYPRKKKPLDARRAFVKALELVDPEILISAAERLASDPNLPALQFVPYPASWLNSGGWDDEPYPERVLSAEEKKQKELDELEHRRKLEMERQEAERIQQAREAELLRIEREKTVVQICEHGRRIEACLPCYQSFVESEK